MDSFDLNCIEEMDKKYGKLFDLNERCAKDNFFSVQAAFKVLVQPLLNMILAV